MRHASRLRRRACSRRAWVENPSLSRPWAEAAFGAAAASAISPASTPRLRVKKPFMTLSMRAWGAYVNTQPNNEAPEAFKLSYKLC